MPVSRRRGAIFNFLGLGAGLRVRRTPGKRTEGRATAHRARHPPLFLVDVVRSTRGFTETLSFWSLETCELVTRNKTNHNHKKT